MSRVCYFASNKILAEKKNRFVKRYSINGALALLVYPCVIQPFIEYGSLSIRQMALPAAFMAFVILAKENE